MIHASPFTRSQQTIGFAIWLIVCFAAAGLGTAASTGAPEFYGQLQRPAWAPPAWLFGPVWTLLYFLMACSAWLAWRVRGFRGVPVALGLFLLQLVANAAWSYLFFALHRGGWAMVDIVLLWSLIVAVIVAFRRIESLAAALLVPYLLWVSFATALNYSIWQLNPGLLS